MSTPMLHIEILTFEGCPNAELAHERVRTALETEGLVARVEQIDVTTLDVARDRRFLGSPSVRVNGKDVEEHAEHRLEYGLMCRTYPVAGQMEGAPSIETIRKALLQCR